MMMSNIQRAQARTVALGALRASAPIGTFEEVILAALRAVQPRAEISDVRRELQWFERGCVARSYVDCTGRRSWKMVNHHSAERH